MTTHIDFLAGLAAEPSLDVGRAPEAPPVPPSTQVTEESVGNYLTLPDNPDYGLTGLMTVVQWRSRHYRTVRAGTVFLFPGTYSEPPPPYTGTVSINGRPHPPLSSENGVALHRQLCAVLGAATTLFVGFGVGGFPFDAPGNVRYNSGVCNEYWFDGDRTLPPGWRQLVYDALAQALPSGPASPSAS